LWTGPPPWGNNAAAAAHRTTEIRRRFPTYLLGELLADINSGHNIVATIFVECRQMFRAGASPALQPVGETEFVNGIAAMSASGVFGDTRVCEGIVSHADLTLGDGVAETLEAHIDASHRFRGIRHAAAYDPDSEVLGPFSHTPPGLYCADSFRAGFGHLGRLGLTFDAWLLEPQLPDLADLARAFPEQPIVLDHVGTPLGIASYRGRRAERFDIWRRNIRSLAACSNLIVKLGGLGMPTVGFETDTAAGSSSEAHAAAWRPYIEECIEAFGPDRCMFESNFPVDKINCSYAVLWNAMKRIAAQYSETEKAALFHGTASGTYRLSSD